MALLVAGQPTVVYAECEIPPPPPPLVLTVEEYVELEAERRGIDPEVALCIARLESGLDPAAQNEESSAAGVLQIIRSTWNMTTAEMGVSWPFDEYKYDAAKNIQVGLYLMANHGVGHWVVAPNCVD